MVLQGVRLDLARAVARRGSGIIAFGALLLDHQGARLSLGFEQQRRGFLLDHFAHLTASSTLTSNYSEELGGKAEATGVFSRGVPDHTGAAGC